MCNVDSRRFWKAKYGLELMKPIAEDLAKPELRHGISNSNAGVKAKKGVWMDTLSDVLRAWGQLALLPGIDIMRSMVMGHSAGGQLALLLAAKAERKPQQHLPKHQSLTWLVRTTQNCQTMVMHGQTVDRDNS